nr:PREDICTED: uncharacterized protein LOC109043233 [Bemisia tabaci]
MRREEKRKALYSKSTSGSLPVQVLSCSEPRHFVSYFDFGVLFPAASPRGLWVQIAPHAPDLGNEKRLILRLCIAHPLLFQLEIPNSAVLTFSLCSHIACFFTVSKGKKMPQGNGSQGGNGGYSYRSSGTNSQGNHYCSRDYGSSAPNPNSYHYSNTNGSYYYSNPNGSTYYANPNTGAANYNPPSNGKQ